MRALKLFINEQLVFEYDRDTELSDKQLEFLDKMDSDMARGIKINGELLPRPDTHQCAKFVALNLIKALRQENSAAVSVSSAYLSNRLPTLNEVHAKDQGDSIALDFIYDIDMEH